MEGQNSIVVNKEDSRRWQDEVLHQILIAIASSQQLSSMLVFKGARVLAMHIPDGTRQSLDIDANCSRAFLDQFPERSKQATVLDGALTTAIHNHFESQSPVRFQIKNVRVKPMPPKGHPHGWNAFEVALQIADLSRPGTRSIPGLQLDIAYPETLTEYSTTAIDIGGRTITVYSLERIAGEKLRAFLSSLPVYRSKVSRPPSVPMMLRHLPLHN